MTHKTVKIGGACAFIGDSLIGPRQLVDVEGMQYLVFDYLAEMTLSSFAQARKVNPALGYAGDFVEVTLREILPRCLERGIRLVANAGGLNPRGCAAAIEALAKEMGCAPRVAFIEGDDSLALLPALAAEHTPDFYTGEAMPEAIDSANVYLGALPIARALALGADIVVTGRIVDSATTLGVLVHEFGWTAEAYDRLAAGSLAGHILECGAQATGGIFTDWASVPDWENIGYPYVECDAEGGFVVCKPAGTGGCVTPATVSEQILYEVGDPARYVLPDVVCDFTQVTAVAAGPDRVRVTGARGMAPPPTYKLAATYQQGWRCTAQVSVFGAEAVAKARRTGDALLGRVRRLLHEKGLGDFERSAVTVLGAEDSYGPHAAPSVLREAIARVAVTHARKEALEIFSREARAPGVSFAPGTTSGSALTLNGRAAVEPRYRLYSCLVAKERLPAPRVVLGDRQESVPIPCGGGPVPPSAASPSAGPGSTQLMATAAAMRQVPLIALAYGRSGDKGDTSNIAVIARRPEDLDLLRRVLTPERVRAYLAHLVHGEVTRYEVPGLGAFNFFMTEALDGGGPSSLRPDPMGKGMAQLLLGMPIPID
ncbi:MULTISPECIES: acyclic terpene utilization AtuA family protein [unclassified Variovorax]|uniref:acyclic terpene utilization AtuA family protein n=1 Tax=unclassified Variovorax TaxID=663243 RepID=UPI0025786ABF|nr:MULTISPECIES: acyclic terpene utilization AtuA family protein [unclassified Variovorax]MDM0086982.1 acyclic terpene utilization AtuA family protein [Variovorax sp. J22G40]MDM0144761.1 acyclic terpene utilization AtuA family protein [Variovorax sp. J2P1-31]